MAGKYYAVRAGKTPGIYTSWDACKAMVHGYPGAVYKSFKTRAEAEAFLGESSGGTKAYSEAAGEGQRTAPAGLSTVRQASTVTADF